MKNIAFLTAIGFLQLFTSCNGQSTNPNPDEQAQAANTVTNRVGGGCEEDYCELMYFGMPKEIMSVDTSAGWYEKGRKLMVTGTVFQIDGRTPAPNVIVYYHHTDNNGYYSPGNGKSENSTRHGHIRGWIKTDEAGKYTIYTIRPGAYPKVEDPEHIHLLIKEPDIANEYWIDDLVFDDDPRLLPFRKNHPEVNPRCGSGTLRVLLKDSLQVAEHDIILGLNIPNYPAKFNHHDTTGLQIGEDQPSFGPFHAYGPDKGSTACPVCKYGRYHGIIYFVGNKPNWAEIKSWLRFLEQESITRKNYLKVYFVYGNENAYSKERRLKELEKIGKELDIKRVALTFVPSFSDTQTEADLNKINPAHENTFIVYKQRRIIDKYIDLKPIAQNFKLISEVLDKTRNDFFNLPTPH